MSANKLSKPLLSDDDKNDDEETSITKEDKKIMLHFKQKILKEKYMICGGVRLINASNIFVKWLPCCIYFGYYLFNLCVMIITVIRSPNSSGCYYIDMTTIAFQIESLIIYLLIVYLVTDQYIDEIATSLSHLVLEETEYKKAQQTMIKIRESQDSSIAIPALSEMTSMSDVNTKKTNNNNNDNKDKKDKNTAYAELQYFLYKKAIKQTKEKLPTAINRLRWRLFYMIIILLPSYISGYFIFAPFDTDTFSWIWTLNAISNVLDFIAYTPRIVYIALITSFYSVFIGKLNALKNEFASLNQLKIKHDKFIDLCQNLISPYSKFTKEISLFLVIFFGLNSLTFTTFIFYFISALTGGICKNGVVPSQYWHFSIELASFWCSWTFLVYPICKSNADLREFIANIRSMSHKDANEKSAIDSYLMGLYQQSPFAIYGIIPTYAQIFKFVYGAFVAISVAIINSTNDADALMGDHTHYHMNDTIHAN